MDKSQEIELLKLECDKTLKNTLRIAADTNEISRQSANKLNEQTEELEKIHNDALIIKDNLDKSDEIIYSIKHPFIYWIKSLFDTDKEIKETNIKATKVINQVNKTKKEDSKIDKEFDELDNILGEMHKQALAMNSTLKYQNNLIGDVAINVERHNERIKQQRKKVNNILN